MSLLKAIGVGDAKDAIALVGNAVGGIADRMGFTKKMSEAEKIDKTIELLKATTAKDSLDMEDLKSAREMAITQMNTQPAGPIVRILNGALRPAAGWWALICLTDGWWGGILNQVFGEIVYTPVATTPVQDAVLAGILAFFFGFRQRAKETQTNLNA